MPISTSTFQRWIPERGEVQRVIRVSRLGLRGLMRSQIPRMAAALSYRTLFAIIPVLVVGMVVLRSFVSKEELRGQLERLLAFVAFDRISLDGTPGDVSAAVDVERAIRGVPAGGTIELDTLLTDLVEKMSSAPLSAIGFVGLVVLIYAALSMLVELEKAFNQVYRAPSGRAWSKRVVVYWTTLTLGTLMLIATFSLSANIANRFELGALRGLLAIGINIIINTILLVLAYTTMPNAKVRFRSALAGAIVAGIVWEVAKVGFTRYVAFSTDGLERFYGAIAVLPLFLLWVYLTWMIVLFGLQVAYALQHAHAWGEDEDGRRTRMIDPAAILLVASSVARSFRAGKPPTLERISNDTNLDERMAAEMVEHLIRKELLYRVELSGEEEAFALSRPAEMIPARDVLSSGETLLSPVSETAALKRLRDVRFEALGEQTLADLI